MVEISRDFHGNFLTIGLKTYQQWYKRSRKNKQHQDIQLPKIKQPIKEYLSKKEYFSIKRELSEYIDLERSFNGIPLYEENLYDIPSDYDVIKFMIGDEPLKDEMNDVLTAFKIQTEEVESLLAPHLQQPFMITKCSDSELGEKVVLLTESTSINDIETTCRTVLPRHWQPRRIICVDAIPLTPNGKPARAEAQKIAEGQG